MNRRVDRDRARLLLYICARVCVLAVAGPQASGLAATQPPIFHKMKGQSKMGRPLTIQVSEKYSPLADPIKVDDFDA